jgi:exonuclease SbcC
VRPLRLEVEGLTAFRERQSIDFASLDLFAISGPTGSGKTSILDAMTYALFGTIDRVGRHAGQFISQGQPRMRVMLEFAVGQDRLRVTRTTPQRGATKIQLETWTGDGWTQAGEGSDRVTEANERIRAAIGLDYDAFTRTVLLPQGKFAEFLVGDAKARRDILTELLGLDLFGRLARRAGELNRSARLEAETRLELLRREYAGVTPDAVADAERIAKDAAETDARAAEVETRVRHIADRWAETARSVSDLRACASEAASLSARATEAADALDGITVELHDAEAELGARVRAAAEASARVEAAAASLRDARERWGTAGDVGALLARAQALGDRRERVAEVEEELASASATIPAREASLAAAEQVLAVCVADVESAISMLGDARDAEEAAAHADHVAAVRAGMSPGEDCPVCGAHVTKLPRARGAPTLDRARTARSKAELAARDADARMRIASAARDDARRSLEAAHADVARSDKELARERADVAALERELAAAFDDELPIDPAAELAARLQALDELDQACDAAGEAARASADSIGEAERRAAGIRTRLAEIRGVVEALPTRTVTERATALLGSRTAMPRSPAAAKSDPTPLASHARAIGERLAALTARLSEAAEDRAAAEADVLVEAAALADGLAAPVDRLVDLVEAVSAARTDAARDAATAEHRAEDLRKRLANAERILEEATRHRSREATYDVLAKELDGRHIIPFLQAEALNLLAAAGSRRLETLSGGRYRLEYAEDEFSVVDTWNGEERRSARTLSGGETFLASLALALGLSEQVRSLAVSDRARLDALFLDEGFGTLDPESLEIVVDAIEQLGGDGRMVGVITHVQELALRLPSRIEVEKSPRGSTARAVTEATPPPTPARGTG